MSAIDLVNASRQTPPVPVGMLPAGSGPTTCHEAVLGWLLMSDQVNQPWKLLEALRHKLIQDGRAPLGGGTLVTGDWMYRNIYTTFTQMRLGWLHQNLAPGDVVFTG